MFTQLTFVNIHSINVHHIHSINKMKARRGKQVFSWGWAAGAAGGTPGRGMRANGEAFCLYLCSGGRGG
jgi:hypothetical protein